MITVQCDSCSFDNKLVFNKKLIGKKVLFSCKNPSCQKRIAYSFPKVAPISDGDETIINNYAPAPMINAVVSWSDPSSQEIMHFALSDGVNIIGRKSSQKTPNIALPTLDKTMSRMHCVITKSDLSGTITYLLKGYNNKNDLVLNGKKLDRGSEVYLQKGDVLRLGKTDLHFDTID